MSMLVAALVFIPLLALAIAYALWSIGRTWPLRSRELLAGAVNGRPGMTEPPARLTSFLIALFFLAAGVAALALADHDSGGAWLASIGIGLAGLFIARGVAGYHPRWRQTFPAEPFATLDRKTYSPLALFLGLGFAVLVLMRLL